MCESLKCKNSTKTRKLAEKKSTIEKRWRSHGFKCKVILVRQSHRCGYVAVPKSHVAYGMDYNVLPIEVHGGLTYGQEEKDGNWWFGFDCAHLGDSWGSSEIQAVATSLKQGHFWTLKEVIEETKKMAEQFSKLTLRDIIRNKLQWMPDWFRENVEIKEEVSK